MDLIPVTQISKIKKNKSNETSFQIIIFELLSTSIASSQYFGNVNILFLTIKLLCDTQ